jgi:nucleoside-diphosphate-sugar epimerase
VKKILVIGGAGFVGSRLSDGLIAEDLRVNHRIAKRGGAVASNAPKEIELKTSKSAFSAENAKQVR